MLVLQILDHGEKIPRKIELGCIFIGQPQYIPPSPFQSNLNRIIPVMVLSVYVQLCREKLSIKLGSISI